MTTVDQLETKDKNELKEMFFKRLILPREITRVEKCYRFPYYLSEDNINCLSKILKRYVTIESKNIRMSVHPVASCLNYFANCELRDEAKLYESFIDIGSDLRIDCPHHCNLVNSHRDAYRYLAQAEHIKDKNLAAAVNANIFDNVECDRFCNNGAENCHFPSRCAVSANSLYDIPIERIPQIFKNHGLDVLIAWMYLPLSLADPDVCGHGEDFYRTEIAGDMMNFYFCEDMSFIYEHNMNNWKKYMTTSIITADDFDIVVEINQRFGPLCKIYFRRVPKYSNYNVPKFVIPLGDCYAEYVKIPNMRFVVASNFDVVYESVPKLVVKRTIAERLYAFISKNTDSAFSYEKASSYYQGLKSRITIANTVVNEESVMITAESDDVLLSIVTLASIARVRRFNTIKKLIEELDREFEYKLAINGVFQRICDWFKTRVRKNFDITKASRYNFNKGDDFMMFTFEYFSNFTVTNVIKCVKTIEIANVNVNLLNDCKCVEINRNKENGKCKKTKILKFSKTNFNFDSDSGNTTQSISDLSSNDSISSDSLIGVENFCDETFVNENANKDFTKHQCLVIDNISDDYTKTLDLHTIDTFDSKLASCETLCSSLQNANANDAIISMTSSSNSIIELTSDVNDDVQCDSQQSSDDRSTMVFDNINQCNLSYEAVDEQIAKLAANVLNDEQIYQMILKVEKCEQQRSVAKFIDVMQFCEGHGNGKINKMLEISVAPGFVHNYVATYMKHVKYQGIHYTGAGHLPLMNNIMHKNKIVHLSDVLKYKNHVMNKYDFIFCDAGNETHDIDVLKIYAHFIKMVTSKRFLVIKMFYNQITTCFDEIPHRHWFLKPNSSLSINKETYLIVQRNRGNTYVSAHVSLFEHKLKNHAALTKYVDCNFDASLNNDVFVRESPPFITTTKRYFINAELVKNFKFEFDINSAKYGLIADKFIKFYNKITFDNMDVELEFVDAVAGAGKTKFIQEKYNKSSDLILVNTCKLKEKYVNAGFGAVKTYHSGLVSSKTFRHVFIDEAFELNLAYIYFFFKINKVNGKIYLFGDSKQIRKIDFDCCCYDPLLDFGDDFNRNFVSHRVPQDICMRLFEWFNYKCFTTNQNKHGLIFTNNASDVIINMKLPVMVLTQESKKRYSVIYPNSPVNTIHELKGKTLTNLVWIIEPHDAKFYVEHVEHVIVAMTRVTSELIVYDQCGILKQTFCCVQNSAIELNLERMCVPLLNNHYFHDQTDRVLKTIDSSPIFGNEIMNVHQILADLSSLIDLYDPINEFASCNILKLPGIEQGNAKLNSDYCNELQYNIHGKCVVDSNVARRYLSTDKIQSISTLFGRYGKKTKVFLRNELFNHYIKDLQHGLSKFMRFDYGSNEFFNHFQADDEEISKFVVDYIKVLNEKHIALDSMIYIDEQTSLAALRTIKYFMKKQTKFDADYQALTKMKYGQGVNSWDKMMNVVFSAYSRFISDKIRTALKPSCFYSIGVADDKIGDAIACLLNGFVEKYNVEPVFVENDFTEYDSSQNALTIEFESDILLLACHNQELVNLYKEHRTHWKTLQPGVLTMHGYAKKHSGEPFTLDFNTILNIAICGCIYDIDELACAAFKGDDSFIAAHNVELSSFAQNKLSEFGFITKVFRRHVCEFTSYIVTYSGFYPDVIRRFIKTCSKVYTDKEDFIEMQNAVTDYLSVIKTRECQLEGRTKLCYFYNNVLYERYGAHNNKVVYITENLIEAIENFLYHFKAISYESLENFNRDVVAFDSTSGSNFSVERM